MKENISIIFAALIGVFLIVLLPLFSLLDRQDSVAYNVVLTETTKFVDKVRTNGFIDGDSYNKYIAAISSTGNTYKVTISAYKKLLIKETDSRGTVIQDSYIETKELYNTKDIISKLNSNTNKESENSTHKNNTYLFNIDDEIYVKVENTNITTGSIIYSMLANTNNAKVVDISYGGVINNINWDLYEKIQAQMIEVPQVVMSVPVNKNNSTNIAIVDNTRMPEYIDCTIDNLEAGTDILDICADLVSKEGENYTYLYDLSKSENKRIRVAVELRGFDLINTGVNSNQEEYTKISDLNITDFNDARGQSNIEKHIIDNYIKTYGMYSPNIDIDLSQNKDYYVFDIYFNDVVMGSIDYISTKATIAILPGLGKDENGTLSLGAESVEIELLDEEAVNTVKISTPLIWNKLLKTKSRAEAAISTGTVYAREDIAFIVSYTGIRDHSNTEIKQALAQHLKIYSNDGRIDGLEVFTAEEFNNKYDIDLTTSSAGHIVIKFRYTEANSSKQNYVQIQDNWITTNMTAIDAEELGYEIREYAMGVVSSHYQVLLDDSPPFVPNVTLEGDAGTNGWYTSDVKLTVLSTNDSIKKGNKTEVGGSGVEKITLTLTGVTKQSEQEKQNVEITANGITNATVKAYDYVGNVSTSEPTIIKIDKEAPTAPTITVSTDTEGTNGWYTSNVKISITAGTDGVSGVNRTTYRITGANALDEKTGTSYTLDKNGTSTIIATTYDNAGNKAETELVIGIDKTVPQDATISVISGEKRSNTSWYYTDVKLKVTVDSGNAISGFGGASYKITGSNEVPLKQIQDTQAEITLDKDGTHTVEVYTYTVAGKVKITSYIVQIDKNAPKAPTIKVNKGTKGNNDWYIDTPVVLEVVPNGDVGPSIESQIRYTITQGGVTSLETDITNVTKTISFTQEGEYTLKVYSRDTALNETVVEEVVKVDKTPPTSADFVITENLGQDNWYTTPVNISHKGATDRTSGIDSVILSSKNITQDTNGKEVILTTKDKAGHEVTKKTVIKVDQTSPIAPTIEVLTKPTGDSPFFGIKEYNNNVKLTVKPGKDYLIEGVDNTAKTICVIDGPDGKREFEVKQQEELTISQSGLTNITITTYDKAGNSSYTVENIWINKEKPATPVIKNINNVNVEGLSIKEIVSESSTISLDIANLTDGNELTIILINDATSEKQEIVRIIDLKNMPIINIDLNKKGKYNIVVTQTNMYGTTSEKSTGQYYYIYE